MVGGDALRQHMFASVILLAALTGGLFFVISNRPPTLRQMVASLETEGFIVEAVDWDAFKESHTPSQRSGLWEGERAYRYEYQETDWDKFREQAHGAESLWNKVYGSKVFVVLYDLSANRVWYLLPFEVNLKTGSIAHYNMVVQWIG